MAPVPLTSNFMPLQPCNAKSDLSASRYSSWWAMRRGDLSTDKVRSKSCLQERSVSPRNTSSYVRTSELRLTRLVWEQHTRSCGTLRSFDFQFFENKIK